MTTPSRRHPPNRSLTWQRLQRGWSREELAAQIIDSMAACGERDSGLTADTVRRWESGERWPAPRFRKHLVLLFALPASALGLLTPDELACRPDPDLRHLVADQNDDTDGSERWWPVTMPEPGGLNRHQFLRGLLGAGLAPLAAGTPDADRRRDQGSDPATVRAYETVTASHRALYWTSPPASLIHSTSCHAQLGADLLRTTTADLATQRRLAAAVTESALLTARLLVFDLGRPDAAHQPFGLATDAVALAGDHALATSVAAHRAFGPGFAGDAAAAQQSLDVAHAHARYAASPLLRSWLHCVTAEIHARTGRPRTSHDKIRQAEDALATDGTDPLWLDFYGAARLDGFAGNADLLAGRHRNATIRLAAALDQLPKSAVKQRAVVLLDLAAAHAPDNPDHALALALQACDILDAEHYATAYQRIPTVYRALTSHTREAADLAERTTTLHVTS